jgi:hypothetical protein
MVNLFDLGLDFLDSQLIEAYNTMKTKELVRDRANAVYERIFKELGKQEAVQIAKEKLKIAEKELQQSKDDFVFKFQEIKKREKKN